MNIIHAFLLIGFLGLTNSLQSGFNNEPIQYCIDKDSVQFVTDNFHEIYTSLGLDKAILIASSAVNVSYDSSWKKEEAYALMCLGVASYLRGNYEQAFPAFQRASDLFDSLIDNRGIALINNELAVFYRKQNNANKVNFCLDKGEKAALNVNDLEALSTNYHHRGETFSQAGDYENALPYFQKVLDIRLELQDSIGLGYIYLDFANSEVEQGNLNNALGYLSQSTAIREKLKDRQGVAVNTVVAGETYFAFEQYQKAIEQFEKTIELAKSIGFTDLTRFAYSMLQKAQVEEGNYRAAYENLSLSQAFSDSLFNIEKSKAIAELETKYETEKKERQIELQQAQLLNQESELKLNRTFSYSLFLVMIGLIAIGILLRKRMILKREKLLEEEKSNTREAQIKAAITSQENERSRFARDLHDGFGQMISILNLNLKSLREGRADKHDVFDKSSEVLEEMYQELKGICFNLMPQTLVKHGVKSAINEFAARVNATDRISIETSFFGLDQRLSDIQEISLYRIGQEWVNNVIKYSDADHIVIQVTMDEEEITLMIEDNGTGFDSQVLIEGKGNGWKNMNSRTNLIKGELELDTRVGVKGSTLIINAPSLLVSKEEQIPV